MASKTDSGPETFTAEVRRVETPYAETGAPATGSTTGYADRVDVTYEIGATINGAWVKFTSVPANTVDALVARAADAQLAADQAASAEQQAADTAVSA